MTKGTILKLYTHLSVRNRSLVIAYGLAFATGIAVLFAHNASVEFIWRASPFLIFLPFVILTSWYGGFLPGLIATIVATIVGDYFFLSPLYTFSIADSADSIRLLLFTTVGLLISIINQTFYNQRAERERLVKELVRSDEHLKKIEKQKTTFLSTIAHELRTPLATTQLINELLLNKFKKTHIREDIQDLQNMHTELTSLSSLVQELLQFVRSEQVGLPLKKEHISLTQLIRSIVTAYQHSHPDYRIHFTESKKYPVFVDGKRMKQVFYNLLDNAIRASKSTDPIFIAIEEKVGECIVSVKDTGTGIPLSQQKNIFKQFYQSSENVHKGFGLGLYIARQIVQKHHGKIWVKSLPQKGSTFYFSLPKHT